MNKKHELRRTRQATVRTCKACGAVHKRHSGSWYCWACYHKARKLAGKAASLLKQKETHPATCYSCVDCGKQAQRWDHRDYYKPLAVEPVCQGCNWKRGGASEMRLTQEKTMP